LSLKSKDFLVLLLLRRAKWKKKKMGSFIGGEEMGAGVCMAELRGFRTLGPTLM
jgi:hypothetical protein